MIFAAALMLSAANANEDVTGAQNRLKRAWGQSNDEPVVPVRRFNLETMIANSQHDYDENDQYWRESEHGGYPMHDPYYHKPMPTGPVRTVWDEPVSSQDHPGERPHQTHTEPRITSHHEPKNYFYEHPTAPAVNDEENEEKMVENSDQEKSQDEEKAEAD